MGMTVSLCLCPSARRVCMGMTVSLTLSYPYRHDVQCKSLFCTSLSPCYVYEACLICQSHICLINVFALRQRLVSHIKVTCRQHRTSLPKWVPVCTKRRAKEGSLRLFSTSLSPTHWLAPPGLFSTKHGERDVQKRPPLVSFQRNRLTDSHMHVSGSWWQTTSHMSVPYFHTLHTH